MLFYVHIYIVLFFKYLYILTLNAYEKFVILFGNFIQKYSF